MRYNRARIVLSSFKEKLIFPNLDSFFIQKAEEGIVVKYADIVFGKYFIYILTPQNIIYPCVIYRFVLSPNDFKKGKKPIIHFCNCKDLWAIYDEDSIILKAKIPHSRLFDFQVGLGKNSSNKLFYNIELPLCETCKEVYESVFLRFNLNPRLELWNLLFNSKKIKNLERIAIEDSIQTDTRYTPMNVNIGENCFYLTRIHNGIF